MNWSSHGILASQAVTLPATPQWQPLHEAFDLLFLNP